MENDNLKKCKICEICKNNASCLCFQCNNYFCESCYKFVHDKQANSGHIKENIDPFVPIDLKCPNHPKDRMNLFCIDEKGKFKNIFIIAYFN